jgi:hypothetical protein
LLRADRVNDALNGFRGVLNISAQAGLYQTILDEGPQVGLLLTTLQENAERTGSSRELGRYIGRPMLGAEKRAQAVSRAQSFGIVGTP